MTGKPAFFEIEALVRQMKCVDRPLIWTQKPTNSNYMMCKAQVLDLNLETMEGCSFEGLYKKPTELSGDQYSFTVHLFRDSVKYRIFQLEVAPWDKVSHRSTAKNEIFYGPHYHIGSDDHWPGEAINIQADRSKSAFQFADWLLDFCQNGNLKFHYPPLPPEVQFELYPEQ